MTITKNAHFNHVPRIDATEDEDKSKLLPPFPVSGIDFIKQTNAERVGIKGHIYATHSKITFTGLLP